MEVITRERRANAAFLRLPRSGNHHDLGLFGVGAAGGPKRRRAIGLYHLAWQLDTIDELVAARQMLLDSRAYTGESSHGATKSLYGADPDGNDFELMWMLPRHLLRPAALLERTWTYLGADAGSRTTAVRDPGAPDEPAGEVAHRYNGPPEPPRG